MHLNTHESISSERGHRICLDGGKHTSLTIYDPLTVDMWPVNLSVLLLGRCDGVVQQLAQQSLPGGRGCQFGNITDTVHVRS